MEIYRQTIGKQSTFVLSTESDLFKFLKSSGMVSTGEGK
jgi:hypothetical protein